MFKRIKRLIRGFIRRIRGRLETDSKEYEILVAACKEIGGVPGLTCEIGVRQGGSSQLIMKSCHEAGDPRTHVGIDPFGNILYELKEELPVRMDYTNEMKLNMLASLYAWCRKVGADFIFMPLEDSEFFTRFADGVPLYSETKTLINEYALVFFDGPHSVKAVRSEIEFFAERTPTGGVWVFDDLEYYPHMEKLDAVIQDLGFKILKQGAYKISYKRS